MKVTSVMYSGGGIEEINFDLQCTCEWMPWRFYRSLLVFFSASLLASYVLLLLFFEYVDSLCVSFQCIHHVALSQ